ncbi:MAG: SAM-dependent methyltransferase, partial [Mycobacterium sp.]
DQPELTHLATPDQLRTVVESAGFAVEHWNDLTDQAASTMQMFLTLPPNPLGLPAFVPAFAEKAQNLTAALTDGRLRAIQAVAQARSPGQ